MRLTCAETEACLVGVSDGHLNPSLEVRVHAHLEECAACRKKADLWWTLVPTMRALSPPPPAEFAVRRMEVALLRSLGADGAVESRPRRRWRAALAAALLVTAAAAAVLWFRVASHPTERGGVVLTRLVGSATSAGQPLVVEAGLPFGHGLEVAAGGEAELRMDRGSTLRLVGPARLTLQGSSRQVLLRLDEGTLEAQVAHRLTDETFAVSARDLTVRVRGTRFVVETGDAGSTVRVQEGLVAVDLTNGSTRMLGTGEQVTTIAPSEPMAAAPVPAAAAVASPEGSGGDSPSCAAAVRRCEGTARGVRARMRAGGDGGALRLLANASRLAREVAPSCAREISSCGDELGYLRAEALSASGRIDEAVNAYVALNRPTAPVAMRQNALFAAAELERRRGRTASARRYYDSARAADPRGALREEALIGSMETAAEAGDGEQARALAKKYLADFPAGRASASARRALRDGAGATTNRPADR